MTNFVYANCNCSIVGALSNKIDGLMSFILSVTIYTYKYSKADHVYMLLTDVIILYLTLSFTTSFVDGFSFCLNILAKISSQALTLSHYCQDRNFFAYFYAHHSLI